MGNGSTIYQEIIKNSGLNVRTVSKDRNIIHGGVIAELGYYYLERGKGANYLEVLPNYLKKAQAEINWLKNNG